jgi:hypothetical protein
MQKLVIFFVLMMAAGFINSEDSGMASAIAGVIEGFFVNQSINFDFIIYRCPLIGLVDEI